MEIYLQPNILNPKTNKSLSIDLLCIKDHGFEFRTIQDERSIWIHCMLNFSLHCTYLDAQQILPILKKDTQFDEKATFAMFCLP